MKKKVKIYVVTHKKYDFPNNEIYVPIMAGSLNKKSNEYLRDDIGDNISDKNSNYSEITALYWIWKNSDADIIGINHYRRYFVNGFLGRGRLLNEDDIINDLNNNDVILYKKKKLGTSIYENFRLYVSEEDLNISCKIFKEMYPEYEETFNKFMENNEMYSYSMFISSKKWVDEYCSWLFPYLFRLEKEIYSLNKIKNVRVNAYIAEMILGVYVEYNKFKIKEYYINFVESKNNFLANLINNSSILAYIYYQLYLYKKKIE